MSVDQGRPRAGQGGKRFELDGQAVRSLRLRLRPVLPKKKNELDATVRIEVESGTVRVQLGGAAVTLPARTAGGFFVQMPYLELKAALQAELAMDDAAVFEFEEGAFTFNRVTSRSHNIAVGKWPSGAGATEGWRVPLLENPVDACVGLPLLAAYRHTRKYGITPTLANKAFLRQQLEVDDLLDDAARLLKPLGIKRMDLELIIDHKIGPD